MYSVKVYWMPAMCVALSRPWGERCQLQRNLAESPSSGNLEMCKGIFKQSKVSRGEQNKAKGKVFQCTCKDKCAKTVFIYFIPTLEWLYRKCSCKKIKLFLNMVSWWFRDNCKYMLWIFLKFNVLMTCIGGKRKYQKLFTGLGTICIPL